MPTAAPIPTPASIEQAGLVQAEMLEAMARLAAEGIDWRVVLTGAASALADVVSRNLGEAEVPRYFAKQAQIAEAVMRAG